MWSRLSLCKENDNKFVANKLPKEEEDFSLFETSTTRIIYKISESNKMDNDFLNESDYESEEENIQWRLVKRYIRDMENPIEFYDEGPFRKRYRFNKGAVLEILLPMVNAPLRKGNRTCVSSFLE